MPTRMMKPRMKSIALFDCLLAPHSSIAGEVPLPFYRATLSIIPGSLSICRTVHLAAWNALLEVCSSEHGMNDTTYCILITTGCLFNRVPIKRCHLSWQTWGLAFYQTHSLLWGGSLWFLHHICDAKIKSIGHLYFYIFALSEQTSVATPSTWTRELIAWPVKTYWVAVTMNILRA